MKHIARNHTVKYFFALSFFVLSTVATNSWAQQIKLPEFSQFNRAINKGSEISYAVKYQGKPTDKLAVGLKSPYEDEWETHSTFTTSLFPVTASTHKKIVFMMRSEGAEILRSKLFIMIRYFNKNGVLLNGNSLDKTIDVPYQWKEVILPLKPKKAATRYAEVWFVKFQDADTTGLTNHPIYVSDVKLK
jgi:hypothetical protein